VEACTDAFTAPKPPWRARKEAYIKHIEHASPSACLISAADKLHNARSILAEYRILGDELWTRFHGGKEGTLWYYRCVVEALRRRAPAAVPAALVDELTRVVSDLETLAGLGERDSPAS
jgi:GTP pyrophosphokinase